MGVHIKARGFDRLTSLDLDDLGSVGRHLVEPTALGDGAGNVRNGNDPPSSVVPLALTR
jgi:hypothetical protein